MLLLLKASLIAGSTDALIEDGKHYS